MKQGLHDYFLFLEVYLLIFFIITAIIITVVAVILIVLLVRCKQTCCLSMFNRYGMFKEIRQSLPKEH